jgi:hypothetical protein
MSDRCWCVLCGQIRDADRSIAQAADADAAAGLVAVLAPLLAVLAEPGAWLLKGLVKCGVCGACHSLCVSA